MNRNTEIENNIFFKMSDILKAKFCFNNYKSITVLKITLSFFNKCTSNAQA